MRLTVSSFVRSYPSFVVALLVACGGQTTGPGGGGGGSGSGSGSGTVGGSGSGSGSSSGSGSGVAACVDFAVGAGDLECATDTDCSFVSTGEICNGACGCGDTSVNTAGASRYASTTSGIRFAGCPCASAGVPRCIAGTCHTGGFMPPPADAAVDGPFADAAACIAVDVSSVDTSCTTALDCVVVPNGTCCNGTCFCNTAVVNVSAAGAFAATGEGTCSGPGACSCPVDPRPGCAAGKCVPVPVNAAIDAG